MELLAMPRRTGKTTQLIIRSYETGIPILTRSSTDVDRILKKAKEFAIENPKYNYDFKNFPKPTTLHNIKSKGLEGPQVLVDDIDIVLGRYFGIEVAAATITSGFPLMDQRTGERIKKRENNG